MSAIVSHCVSCDAPLPLEGAPSNGIERNCPDCATRQRHYVFPAFLRAEAAPPATPFSDENAACYFHDSVGASTLCDDCGRYLCTLCHVEMPQPANRPAGFPKTVCPACYAHRVAEEHSAPWDLMQTNYVRYDLMALLLALVPLLLGITFLLTPLTAPIAFFVALRYWGRSRNPVKRYYLLSMLALLLVMGVLFIWVAFVALVFAGLWGAA